jgi:hypothetical protein
VISYQTVISDIFVNQLTINCKMNQKVKKLIESLVAVIFLSAVAGFTSCEKFNILPQPFDPSASWSLKSDIQPIFNSTCALASCHGGARSPNLSEGKSYNSLSKGGYINPPYETSRLYLQMQSGHPNTSLSDVNRKKILYWVTQGAQNN